MKPVDFHDPLQNLRGVNPSAVGQERICPHTWATDVDGILGHLPTSGPLALDSVRFALCDFQTLDGFHDLRPTLIILPRGINHSAAESVCGFYQNQVRRGSPASNGSKELCIAPSRERRVELDLCREPPERYIPIVKAGVYHGSRWQPEYYRMQAPVHLPWGAPQEVGPPTTPN